MTVAQFDQMPCCKFAPCNVVSDDLREGFESWGMSINKDNGNVGSGDPW